jgi:hypothetical protein
MHKTQHVLFALHIKTPPHHHPGALGYIILAEIPTQILYSAALDISNSIWAGIFNYSVVYTKPTFRQSKKITMISMKIVYYSFIKDQNELPQKIN